MDDGVFFTFTVGAGKTGLRRGRRIPRRDAIVIAVEKASPAVVNISTEQIHKEGYPFSMDSGDPYLGSVLSGFLQILCPQGIQDTEPGIRRHHLSRGLYSDQ